MFVDIKEGKENPIPCSNPDNSDEIIAYVTYVESYIDTLHLYSPVSFISSDKDKLFKHLDTEVYISDLIPFNHNFLLYYISDEEIDSEYPDELGYFQYGVCGNYK